MGEQSEQPSPERQEGPDYPKESHRQARRKKRKPRKLWQPGDSTPEDQAAIWGSDEAAEALGSRRSSTTDGGSDDSDAEMTWAEVERPAPPARYRREKGRFLGGARTTPVRLVEAGPFVMEVWVEETSAKVDMMRAEQKGSQAVGSQAVGSQDSDAEGDAPRKRHAGLKASVEDDDSD